MHSMPEHSASSLRLPQMRIGVAASLTFIALAALILDPLFGSLAALAFLLAGGLLLVTKPLHSLGSMRRYLFVLILPAYCLLSVLWSQYPALSLRYSVQLALTVSIAIVIANRVAPLTFLRCLFGIYGIGVVGSLLFGRVRDDIGAWIGIFGSKNAFAAVVAGFALTATAVLFDKSSHWTMRTGALAGLALTGPLLAAAQSAGSIVVLAPAVTVALAILLSRRMTRTQKAFIGILMAMTGLLAMLVVAGYGEQLFRSLLDVTGKDVTLTGRTELWAYGREVIAEHPLLGVGYQAFWVQGYGPAEMLWATFGIASRTGFNFHNTYISNAVEIGFIGLAIQVALLYGAWIGVLIWALRAPRPENAFFASFLTMVICASFGEVSVFFQFSVTSVIALCALVYAMEFSRIRKRQSRLTYNAAPLVNPDPISPEKVARSS